MLDFPFSYPHSLPSFSPNVLPPSLLSYLPLLKWNWIKEGKKGVGVEGGVLIGFC